MARHRVTMFFNQSVLGWSETYVSRDVAGTGAADLFQRLINRRNDLLFHDEHKWVGVRDALVGLTRQSNVYLPGESKYIGGGSIIVPAQGNRVDLPGVVEDPDLVGTSLQYLVRFDGNRKAIRYLVGLPDGVSRTQPATMNFLLNPDWKSKFDAFVAQLSSDSWAVQGIVAPTAVNNVPVQALVVHDPAPGILGVGMLSATLPALGDPPLVHLRGFRRRGRGGISLNGKFYVDSVNTTLRSGLTFWFLRGTAGVNPDDWKILGKVQPVQSDFFTIQSAVEYRVGGHRRGRPSMAPRGRRLARLTLDP